MRVSGILLLLFVCVIIGVVSGDDSLKKCDKGWECSGSHYCCNETISKNFQVYQFEELFAKRNSPLAHAVGFWDYQSFILASSVFQSLGFGTTGGKQMGMMEVAAFLGHVGSKTSCGYGVATGGPMAWGLCYNKEMSPSSIYCDDSWKAKYPCTDGISYHGRGAIPLYWNYNYGKVGEGLKMDLLNHPEYVEQNATIAFMTAMYQWMTSPKKKQPSPHEAFTGIWTPSKNDTLSKRTVGFGTTMNLLYGDLVCGQGFPDTMNNIMSHYLYYLDLLGIGREAASTNLDCSEQVVFNPSSENSASS